MPRRTKLFITVLFLVLLAIPAIYITLSWETPAPFEFRFLRQGEPVLRRGRDKTEVPFYIEVRNTQPYPIHLWAMEMMGEIPVNTSPSPVFGGSADGDAATGAALSKIDLPIGGYRLFSRNDAGDDVPPIPAYGSIQVEIDVAEANARDVDRASLHIEYVSSSVVKNKAIKLALWMERKVWDWFGYQRRFDASLYPERHHAPLHGAIIQPPPPSQ
jgi:hypothetical protein